MAKVPLSQIALGRSGDKGDSSNIGLIARTPALYEVLLREVTADRVKAHFASIAFGAVDRYEAQNLRSLNFILHDSLGGCGSESLRTDAQGKTHALGLLAMEVDVPDELLPN